MMSSALALPSRGRLEQFSHMVGYLKKCHNAEMLFHPSEPSVAH